MHHNYNRERSMDIVLNVSFEELRLIRDLARAVGEMEEMPDGVWSHDVKHLGTYADTALHQAAVEAAEFFRNVAESSDN